MTHAYEKSASFQFCPYFYTRIHLRLCIFQRMRKKDTGISDVFSKSLMGGQGIEPWTHGLRVRCSAS